jgi:hypothetical protein
MKMNSLFYDVYTRVLVLVVVIIICVASNGCVATLGFVVDIEIETPKILSFLFLLLRLVPPIWKLEDWEHFRTNMYEGIMPHATSGTHRTTQTSTYRY